MGTRNRNDGNRGGGSSTGGGGSGGSGGRGPGGGGFMSMNDLRGGASKYLASTVHFR